MNDITIEDTVPHIEETQPDNTGSEEVKTMPKSTVTDGPVVETPQPGSFIPLISLREYCIGKPLEVLHALAAHTGGHPSRMMRTAQDWDALKEEVMNAPAVHSPIG
jgi:hypothetical protein